MQRLTHRAVVVQELASAVSFHEAPLPTDRHVFLLDCAGPVSPLSRYSFLCLDPVYELRSKRSICYGGPPGDLRELPGRPFDELDALLSSFPAVTDDGELPPVPFHGGAVGYLGYEMLYGLERVPDTGRDDLVVPDCYLAVCRTVLATDHATSRSWLLVHGFGRTEREASEDASVAAERARQRVAELPPLRDDPLARRLRQKRDAILAERPRLQEKHLAGLGIRPVMSREGYLDVVAAAREHIFAGDVFEICTTQRFDVLRPASGYPLYRALRSVNPSPFAAYLRCPGLEVSCSSPERFLRLDASRNAETRPIKGTRPRGRTPEQDRAFFEDLAASEKDHAENAMIVDLARNDLGRVCEFGSVTVPDLQVIESYPYTHQLVSTVRGKLRPEHSPIDLVRAAFPGGSMTGAPKIEAMKIIDNLEPVKRGVFSGGIGYFDFAGPFDLNIVIRTLVRCGSGASFHVGGAIVADSDPEEEYQETLDKAHGLITALQLMDEVHGA